MYINQNCTNIETLKNGRPTIAVLVASMTSFYHEGIMRGATDGAEEKGLNIIVYSGGPLNPPDPTAQSRETVFDLVDMNLIDGVIIPVSSHTRYLSKDETKGFLDKFSSVPIINLSSSIEGCINIKPDFEPGLSQIVDHFVNDHKFKRIAFFRGPKGHLPSDERTELYRKQLIKHNISIEESLIIYSDLFFNAAKNAVSELFDKRGETCDAIISLNDGLALGTIEALSERGLRVPEDIAVCGTLDVPSALFSLPPLTTIKEPIYELGKMAILTLSEILGGKDVPSDIYIPTSLVKRNSCGCKSLLNKKKSITHSNQNTDAYEEDLEKICQDILTQYRCLEDRDILAEIMNKFGIAKRKNDSTPFIEALRVQLEKVVQTEKILGWLEITSKIQLDLTKDLGKLEDLNIYKSIMDRIITLKSNIEDKMVKYHNYELNYYNGFFRYILNTLNTSFNLKAVKKSAMELLNISDFYISVYIDEIGDSLNRYAKNIMAVKCNEDYEITKEYKTFPARQLIPCCISPYKERYSLMIFPLSFRKKPLGFLIFDLSRIEGSIFENLQATISAALKNELQIQDLKRAEERFSDIAHSTSNWLWETDESNRFTYCSLSVYDILGYTSREVKNKSIIELSVPHSDSFFKAMLDREILSDVECWFNHKKGKVMCLLISAKPINKSGLFVGYRGVFKDITEQKFQVEKINHLAYYDLLTDLPNRALFQEKLENVISYSIKNEKTFSLIFLDIDRFKFINDSLGHASGDLLLKLIGERLNKSIRNRDILARLGGDEFTIILPDIDDSHVIIIADRIMKSFTTPVELNNELKHVTMSLGIAMFPNDGKDTVSLLKRADNAMYQAKSQGRNCYVFYDREIEENNAKRKINEENLYYALDNDNLILFYQPQVHAMTGEIKGLEALVRIKKESEIISPDNFIPLAEELGLIWRIDESVFRESCRQYNDWQKKGLGKIRISINLSALQLRNKDLVKSYFAILEEYQVDPHYIQLEITENALIENEKMALEILQQFKGHGISIALDDFGTGYSSLQCISLYPIDTVKIDRSFVRDAVFNRKSEAIIKAIVNLANNLDLKIIAEGVETREQHEFIKSLGCDEIQGYYFHKPCPARDIEILIGQR